MSTLWKCILCTCTQPQCSFTKTIYPPLILVFYIELGTLYCLKCSCLGNLGQPPPMRAGVLVNEWYIIQHSYNCTISVCNQTHHWKLKTKKTTEKHTETKQWNTFPPHCFLLQLADILSFGNLAQPRCDLVHFQCLGASGLPTLVVHDSGKRNSLGHQHQEVAWKIPLENVCVFWVCVDFRWIQRYQLAYI